MNHRFRGFGASWGGWQSIIGFIMGVAACGTQAGQTRCDPAVDTCVTTTATGGTTTGAAGSTTTGSASGATTGASTTATATSGGTAGAGGAPGSGGQGGGGGTSTVPMMRTFTSRVVGYLPIGRGSLRNWITAVPWYRVSHVDIAFANASASGLSFDPGQEMYLGGFVSAAHAAGAKVLVSIGGAGQGSTDVSNLYVPATVDAFVANVGRYLDTYNLDGIDVDVEGDTVNQNYGPFVDKLVALLRPKGKLVTSALAQWFAANIPAATYKQFDFVNVMSYDHCGSTPCEHSTYDAAVRDLDYFKNKGVPTDRLVLGVPFYCHCWGTTCPDAQVDYAVVLAKFPGGMDYIQSAGITYSCNGPATILKKAMLAHGFGGVMAWQIAQDAAGDMSLLKVIADNL